ncbi:MAG: GlgB N-terminal domain-containing protein, partial [Verrucomicrobiota bacterium]
MSVSKTPKPKAPRKATYTTNPELDSILEACNGQPHALLGMHPVAAKGKQSGGLVVRAFLQDAASCEVVELSNGKEQRYPLERVDDEGFFEGKIEGRSEVFPYRLRAELFNGEVRQFYDPYSFLPTVSEDDLYWFNEGTDLQVYKKLGSHVR